MAQKRPKLTLSKKIQRLSFPEAEAAHEWLPMLLDAYHIADQGVSESIRQVTAKGRKLACAKGCSTCCICHRSIPAYPIELVGLTWYATEILSGELRQQLKIRLHDASRENGCVFLLDGACSIHPMRPMACRHFNVFDTPCAEGEDAFFTRRKDVLTPIRDYTDEAFFHMLPFYGVKKAGDRRKIIKKGQQHEAAKDFMSMKWEELARRMEIFDQKNT